MSIPYPAYGNPRPQVGENPYMYPPNTSSSQYSFANSSTTIPGKHEFNPVPISRTPSPTPSEAAELERESVVDWKTVSSWRFWLRREWLCAWSPDVHVPLMADHLLGYYLIAIILIAITALITIFHHQIVDKLTPTAQRVKRSVFLCILSFPLFLFLFGPWIPNTRLGKQSCWASTILLLPLSFLLAS
jgi:hypothetical protein